ncbi:MFS transporter [Alloscardovia criceti]|uniref:hypothetical protein n=1 Tax=Alloscardovia criceti TaxID=356828 RepID=UPI000374E4C6|nr:hypothetical protein [Alloscardovia criceti]
MVAAASVSPMHYSIIMVVFNFIGLPVSMIIPFFVARTRRRYHVLYLAGITSIQLIVIVLFRFHAVLGTSYWYLFSIVSCIFFTSLFVMVLTFYPIKTLTSADTADISGISQSAGYFIASLGPVLYGSMYGDGVPTLSFAWAMAGVVIFNAWCAWQVIRLNKFGLSTLQA